jgi:hypothetical protein
MCGAPRYCFGWAQYSVKVGGARVTVRFYFNCRHPAALPRTAGRGQIRTLAVQQTISYSITSSAMASSDGGTVRPSALAVLRLITSSNLVGCCTGRSAGFSPRVIYGNGHSQPEQRRRRTWRSPSSAAKHAYETASGGGVASRCLGRETEREQGRRSQAGGLTYPLCTSAEKPSAPQNVPSADFDRGYLPVRELAHLARKHREECSDIGHRTLP